MGPRTRQLILQGLSLFLGLAGLGAFILLIYIGPHLLWKIPYYVPEYVYHVAHHLQTEHDFQGRILAAAILLPLLFISLLLLYLARLCAYLGRTDREDEQIISRRSAAYLETQAPSPETEMEGELPIFEAAEPLAETEEETAEATNPQLLYPVRMPRTYWWQKRPFLSVGILLVIVLGAIFIFEWYVHHSTSDLFA